MGANVYANGMEISGKAAPHKYSGAMPDVCLSPPSPPAGPIPIPYPNFSMASKTSGGTRTVKISGKEVSLKRKSQYKSCKGDAAATRNFGAGVISHNLDGAVQHVAGSFNVKFEGTSVSRHLDLTTGNHNNPTNGSGSVVLARQAPAPDPKCQKLDSNNESKRRELADRSSDKSIIGKDGNGRGTTVASMKAGRKTMAAHNNQKAASKFPDGLVPGGDNAVRSGKKSPLCAASTFKHPAPAMQKSGHAEARMFAKLASSPPTNITLSIDWRPSRGRRSKMPCRACHKMLCAAANVCGHNISLCDKKKQPQPLECPKPRGKAEGSYERMRRKMGEGPSVAR